MFIPDNQNGNGGQPELKLKPIQILEYLDECIEVHERVAAGLANIQGPASDEEFLVQKSYITAYENVKAAIFGEY